MNNHNEIVGKTDSSIKNEKYSNLSELIKFSSENFLELMLENIHKISLFIKKIKIIDDPQYFELNKEYSKILKKSKTKLENLIKKLILYSSTNIIDIRIGNFENITNLVDDMLEKVSDNIDILKGIKRDKKESEIEEELNNIKNLKETNIKYKGQLDNLGLKNKIIFQSDDFFDIDNSYYPFIPKIKTKPYSSKSKEAIDNLERIQHARKLRSENQEKFKLIKWEDRKENKEQNMCLFTHPYITENNSFLFQISERVDKYNKYYSNIFQNNSNQIHNIINFEEISIGEFYEDKSNDLKKKYLRNKNEIIQASKNYKNANSFQNYFINTKLEDNFSFQKLNNYLEFKYLSLEATPFLYVDTYELFSEMLQDLQENIQEIAVDLEHHSTESYLGITCLMQISTRWKDYVIDTIKLRIHLQELNIIFCDPEIVKVLHGADFDIEWLQKDFGLYIVNMFDTGQAARILQFPSFGLSYLLSSICEITTDKKYQLSDWRLRPLPLEMIKYAREDTHYLLYIYDILQKNLLKKSMVKNEGVCNSLLICFKKSIDLCLKQYCKPLVKSYEYYQMLARNSSHLNKRQVSLLKLIFKFRDFIARKLDLAPFHILSNRVMFNLVKLTKFDAESIYTILEKHSSFRHHVNDLIKLIDAKLISNEKKIQMGDTSKVLERKYLENIREKMNESKIIVKTLSDKTGISLRGVINEIEYNNSKKKEIDISKLNVEMIKNAGSNSKFNMDEIKSIGVDVNFKNIKTTKISMFCNDNNFNYNNYNSITNDNDKIYTQVLDDLNNFNIVKFLEKKHCLKNIKIEKRQPATLIKEIKQVIPKVDENVNIIPQKTENKFLSKKRKNSVDKIPCNMKDLTNYKNITNKQIYNKEDSDSEESEEKEKIEKHKYNNKKSNLKINYSQGIKNMVASAKFIEDLGKNLKKPHK